MHKISIIGLGYVGLPLALQFSKIYEVKAYDINLNRIKELQSCYDSSGELLKKDFINSKFISFTNKIEDLKSSNIYIITVPTPITPSKKPNLKNLSIACKNIGKYINKGNIVIFESTVYPGVTEDYCVPILEKSSKLIFNRDFFCGYSPERINPGDKKHSIVDIVKITSGSNIKTANIVDKLYSKIIKAGTHKVSSIKIAEAAKIIENIQRDINIAFVNEISMIFHKMKIDTKEVLDAASTKWNFLDFKPGLVGGHCIGVDPYYLTFKAQQLGLNPKIILAGRKVNDDMSKFVTNKLIYNLKKIKLKYNNSKVLIMGFSFKENCKDIRNTKVIEIYNLLKKKGCKVDIYDPLLNNAQIMNLYKIKTISYPKKNNYDAILIAVAHNYFKKIGIEKIRKFGKSKHFFFDLKYLFNTNKI